jgi:hypothetical protein
MIIGTHKIIKSVGVVTLISIKCAKIAEIMNVKRTNTRSINDIL